jgi:hypothetical protein
MSRMRAASARPDERGVRLGDLHYFRDLANFFASQSVPTLDGSLTVVTVAFCKVMACIRRASF